MALVIIGREIRFSASHRLPNVPAGHKCGRLHGHTYRVTLEVSGSVDETLGWVADFGLLDIALRQMVHLPLDHQNLNDIPGLNNPTSERLAQWCAERLALTLHGVGDLRIRSVSVYEGDGGGWARWEPGEPETKADEEAEHREHLRSAWATIDNDLALRSSALKGILRENKGCWRCQQEGGGGT